MLIYKVSEAKIVIYSIYSIYWSPAKYPNLMLITKPRIVAIPGQSLSDWIYKLNQQCPILKVSIESPIQKSFQSNTKTMQNFYIGFP